MFLPVVSASQPNFPALNILTTNVYGALFCFSIRVCARACVHVCMCACVCVSGG